MEVLHVFEIEPIQINSHKGKYSVYFPQDVFKQISTYKQNNSFIIIDKKVKELYQDKLLQSGIILENALTIEATEEAKSFEKISQYIEILITNKIRRNYTIVTIGGGVIQDIACFISSLDCSLSSFYE